MIDKDTIIKLAVDAGFLAQRLDMLAGHPDMRLLERFAQAIYRQGLEDAANIVQANAQLCATGGYGYALLSSNAAAIRSLKESTNG